MGPQNEDYLETVLTCEGDYHDPDLHRRLESFRSRLKDLLLTDMHKLILKKVEPWNSVRVTFNIPREAALRLKHLAQQGNSALRQLGVLAVQLQGDQLVSLTIAGRNNERTELILRTTEPRPLQPNTSSFDSGLHSSDELNSPGPSNVEVTRKNIAEYLRQGTSLFDTIIQPPPGPGNGIFRSPNVVATSSEPIPFHPNSVVSTSPGNTSTATSQAPIFMSNFPPGRNPPPFPPASTSPSRSPSHQPQAPKYPSPPRLPPAVPPPQHMAAINHVGLPPPPPYPGGATVNNIPRQGKAVSVSSPLLVNLLQTEPLVAGFNNLPPSKMLPPQEGGPAKKRRRPKKAREDGKPAGEGEVQIQSVINPALDPLSSRPNDRVESSMDCSPSEPGMTLNPGLRTAGLPQTSTMSPVDSEAGLHALHMSSQVLERLPNLSDFDEQSLLREHDPFPPEITAGKIINPYTGQLEPVDKSPVKNAGGKFVKTDSRINRENVHDLFLTRGMSHVNKRSATVTSDIGNVAGHVSEGTDLVLGQRTRLVCPPVSSSVEILKHSPVSTSVQQIYAAPSVSSLTSSVSSLTSSASSLTSSSACSQQVSSQGLSVTASPSIEVPSLSPSQVSAVPHNVQNSVESPQISPPPFSSGLSCPVAPQTEELHNMSNSDSSKSPPDSVVSAPPDVSVGPTPGVAAKPSAKPDSLLNSPSARQPTDSNCISASPENKMPSEGDENSNHSGIISDMTTDTAATAAAFLETGSSKVYNHDSGVGSSSERSDDTPSEPGDEYRGTQPPDSEESTKAAQKAECKSEAKQVTVGYVMEHEQPQTKDKIDLANLPFSKDKLANVTHVKNHVNMVYPTSDLHANNQVTVLQWSSKDTKHLTDPSLLTDHTHLANSELLINSRIGKLKNGPVLADDSVHRDVKRSSPELELKGLSSSPESKTADAGQIPAEKLLFAKGLSAREEERARSPSQMRDTMSAIEPTFPASQPATSLSPSDTNHLATSHDLLGLPGLTALPPGRVCDGDSVDNDLSYVGPLEPNSPDSDLCLFPPGSPKSVAQFFPGGVDLDSLAASAKVLTSKGEVVSGSNITSKYSKRSSPVNVNMLNHIYAPGLPLPRRLTESIQRLVKPLGDNSLLPQMRACKSPGAKHGPNGDKSPRAPGHSSRAPGPSVPRSSVTSVSQPGLPMSLPSSSLPCSLPGSTSAPSVSSSHSGLPMSHSEALNRPLCSENSHTSFSDRTSQHSTPHGTFSSPTSGFQAYVSSSLAAAASHASKDMNPQRQHQAVASHASLDMNPQRQYQAVASHASMDMNPQRQQQAVTSHASMDMNPQRQHQAVTSHASMDMNPQRQHQAVASHTSMDMNHPRQHQELSESLPVHHRQQSQTTDQPVPLCVSNKCNNPTVSQSIPHYAKPTSGGTLNPLITHSLSALTPTAHVPQMCALTSQSDLSVPDTINTVSDTVRTTSHSDASRTTSDSDTSREVTSAITDVSRTMTRVSDVNREVTSAVSDVSRTVTSAVSDVSRTVTSAVSNVRSDVTSAMMDVRKAATSASGSELSEGIRADTRGASVTETSRSNTGDGSVEGTSRSNTGEGSVEGTSRSNTGDGSVTGIHMSNVDSVRHENPPTVNCVVVPGDSHKQRDVQEQEECPQPQTEQSDGPPHLEKNTSPEHVINDSEIRDNSVHVGRTDNSVHRENTSTVAPVDSVPGPNTENCVVSGWGDRRQQNSHHSMQAQHIVQESVSPIVDRDVSDLSKLTSLVGETASGESVVNADNLESNGSTPSLSSPPAPSSDLCRTTEAADISEAPKLEPVLEPEVTRSSLQTKVSKPEQSADSVRPLKKVAELLKCPSTNTAPQLHSVAPPLQSLQSSPLQSIAPPLQSIAPPLQSVDNESLMETHPTMSLGPAGHEADGKTHMNASQPPVLQPEVDALPNRRLTRKRKSTLSESDSNSKESDTDSVDQAKPVFIDSGPPPLQPPVRSDSRRETRRHAHADEANDKTEKHSGQDKAKDGHSDKRDGQLERKEGEKRVEGELEHAGGKKSNASRRNKTLPPVPPLDKTQQQQSFFHINIIRGRTRSQSTTPGAVETKAAAGETKTEKEKEESPESQKRSTRSSRQKDHPDQPVAKRRRSRDHR